MRQLPTGEPVWDLQFDEKGQLTAPGLGEFADEVTAAGVTDLFAFSHGWGASQDSARGLYDRMFPMIRDAARGAAGIGKVGFAGIYWPSLWFPPTPATPPPAAGSQQAGSGALVDLSAGTAALSGADIASSLLPRVRRSGAAGCRHADRPADRRRADRGRLSRVRRRETTAASADRPADQITYAADSSRRRIRRFRRDRAAAHQRPGDGLPGGGGRLRHHAISRAQQGIGDWFTKAINGAKDALRVLSYTTMKARAGTIGRNGLGPLLAALHARSPAVRVHLIGHSFGARLVSFALSGVGTPADSPIASLLLVQGAFSTGPLPTPRTTRSAVPEP